MPAISSGLFGFSKPLCAKVFFQAIKEFVSNINSEGTTMKLKLVRLSNIDAETTEIFMDEFMD